MLTQYVNGKFVFLQLIFFPMCIVIGIRKRKKNIEILYFSLKKKGKSNETRKSLFLNLLENQ